MKAASRSQQVHDKIFGLQYIVNGTVDTLRFMSRMSHWKIRFSEIGQCYDCRNPQSSSTT
jgi:hypothetical protein